MGNGYDIYKIDSNGFEVKIGSVKKAPWQKLNKKPTNPTPLFNLN